MDHILLVFQCQENLSSVLELLDRGVSWEESVPHREYEVHEGPELDCSLVASALGVFTRSGAVVESQGYQVGNMTGFGVGGEGLCGDDGVDDAKWDGRVLFNRRFLLAVGFELPGEMSVQSCVGLGIGRISWVRKAIQEVGRLNSPPCLRNQLFPKLVHSEIVLLGMSDPVSIFLHDFNSREG